MKIERVRTRTASQSISNFSEHKTDANRCPLETSGATLSTQAPQTHRYRSDAKSEAEQCKAEEIFDTTCIYERVGYDQRPMTFLRMAA